MPTLLTTEAAMCTDRPPWSPDDAGKAPTNTGIIVGYDVCHATAAILCVRGIFVVDASPIAGWSRAYRVVSSRMGEVFNVET